MKISPYILGHGRAGLAAAKSLSILSILHPEWGIQPVEWLSRGAPLKPTLPNPILVITNPHGLHKKVLLEAEEAGYKAIFCEKPACVTLEEVEELRGMKTPVGIFHGYRLMWGPRTLKQMIQGDELGQVFSIEGRYWSSSSAEKALGNQGRSESWKNNVALSGPWDALLDLGTHWVDLATYLYGEKIRQAQGWRSYNNAEAPHRDTHLQLTLDFPSGGRALTSISKNVHGATNQFEIHVLGSKKSASWFFLNPDELVIGEGKDRRILTRKEASLGTLQPAFHGAGWLEGYIEVMRQLLQKVFFKTEASYPTLEENLDMLSKVLSIHF